jgi:hypothetical protein
VTEIEFFLSESEEDPVAEPAPPHPAAISDIRLAGPCVLWLAAAGLLLIAPFRLDYSLNLRFLDVRQSTSADGWGRVRRSFTGTSVTEHGPRYGIVLSVAAGLVLVAAGLAALAAVRRSGYLRVASGGTGLVGAALAAGVASAALLNAQSLRDNIKNQLIGAFSGSGRVGIPRTRDVVHLTTGWMVWLTAIAVGSAAGAVLLLALPEPRRDQPGEPEAGFAPPFQPELHPQDEVLDTKHPGRRELR